VLDVPNQVGDSLEEFLFEATQDAKLRQVLMSLSEAVRTIAFKVGIALIRPLNAGKQRFLCVTPSGAAAAIHVKVMQHRARLPPVEGILRH
jgi:hypothetical protein